MADEEARGQRTVTRGIGRPATKPIKENLEDLLRVEPLSIEVGVGLISFIAEGPGSPLLRRIASIRKQLATELGFIIPAVRVTDNLSLRAREYSICLKGIEVARFELPQGSELAIALTATEQSARRQGDKRSRVRRGCVVGARVEGRKRSRVGLYGNRSAKRDEHASRGTDQALRTRAVLAPGSEKTARPRQHRKRQVVEDLVPKLLPLATVQRVIQNLLRERVSIRDAVSILEALGEAAPQRGIRFC